MTTTKKKAGRTHIVMVLDRSGSMSSIKSDMEGAINEYVKDQQKVDGECTFTFAQFDTEHEVLLDHVDLQEVGDVTIEPRGMTALHDAMGLNLTNARTYVKGLSKDKAPEHKLYVVITDGHENSSKEWTKEKVSKAIAEAEGEGWTVVYLGANQDAIAVGGDMGTQRGSTMTFAPTQAGVKSAVASSSVHTSMLRGTGNYGGYDEDERKDSVKK